MTVRTNNPPSSTLPTGAATETTLAALLAKLPSVLVADRLKVDGSGVTQPVSAAALPLPAGAATEATLAALPKPSTLTVVLQPAANTGGTLTLPAAGAGLFHYITRIRIARQATAVLAGTALLAITTTNLNGRAYRVGNVMAAGGHQRDVDDSGAPIKSAVANTATTIVVPVPGAAVSWDVQVDYYAAA